MENANGFYTNEKILNLINTHQNYIEIIFFTYQVDKNQSLTYSGDLDTHVFLMRSPTILWRTAENFYYICVCMCIYRHMHIHTTQIYTFECMFINYARKHSLETDTNNCFQGRELVRKKQRKT